MSIKKTSHAVKTSVRTDDLGGAVCHAENKWAIEADGSTSDLTAVSNTA